MQLRKLEENDVSISAVTMKSGGTEDLLTVNNSGLL